MLQEYPFNFKKIEKEDIPLLRAHIEKRPKRICDFTPGCLYMWGRYYGTTFAMAEDTLVLRVKHPTGDHYAMLPATRDYVACAEWLYGLSGDFRPLRLCAVTKEESEALTAHFGTRAYAYTSRNWSDYLYLAEEMREFSGKKYHRQKNHINAFMRDNPDWRFEPITKDNFGHVLAFYADFRQKYVKDAKSAKIEAEAVETVLSAYDRLALPGGILYAGGRVAGFSVGEVVGDILYVHIEKASLEFRGAYQMLVQEFARAYATGPVVYINREDDAGDEGLRTSKLSYRPIELIDKYVVTIA